MYSSIRLDLKLVKGPPRTPSIRGALGVDFCCLGDPVRSILGELLEGSTLSISAPARWYRRLVSKTSVYDVRLFESISKVLQLYDSECQQSADCIFMLSLSSYLTELMTSMSASFCS